MGFPHQLLQPTRMAIQAEESLSQELSHSFTNASSKFILRLAAVDVLLGDEMPN